MDGASVRSNQRRARAGTLARVEHALAVKADSLDSSFPLWTRQRFAEFCTFFDKEGPPQIILPGLIESIASGMGVD